MNKEEIINILTINLGMTDYITVTKYLSYLEEENKKYKKVIDKLKNSIDECWYMDSENVGEQVFLKKCELLNILKEVE